MRFVRGPSTAVSIVAMDANTPSLALRFFNGFYFPPEVSDPPTVGRAERCHGRNVIVDLAVP